MSTPHHRPGYALALVIVALLLLEILVLGGLGIAAGAASLTGAADQRLQARLDAESAIRLTLAEWTRLPIDTLREGAILHHPATPFAAADATIERIAPARYLIAASSRRTGTGRILARALVAALPRDSLLAFFTAALDADGFVDVRPDATLDGLGSPPCAASAVPALVTAPGNARIDPAATLTGAPATAQREVTTPRTVAGIPIVDLMPLADIPFTASTATPRATTCAGTDPLDWGDPLHSDPACRERHPFIATAGDLTLHGGVGQGTLLVLGRLRITGDARFHGAIIAHAIDLDAGTVTGAVRTLAADTSSIAGTIRHDACTLERALDAPALRRPFRHGPRLWLPAR